MKKLIRTDNKQEVKFGDIVTITHKTPFSITSYSTVITKYNYKEFICSGILEEVTETTDPYQHLADRMNWDIKDCTKFLEALTEICPKAAFNLMCEELSNMEDKSDASTKWIISAIDGKVKRLNPSIPITKGFTSFDSKEYAEKARRILEPLAKLIYNE